MIRIILTIIAIAVLSGRARSVEPTSTFSIVGCDPETGELGVAVASKYFAVGSVVPWAEAGVGAIATQSYLNYDYGIDGLAMLKAGLTSQQVIDSLTRLDPGFARRQIGVIDARGVAATFTGEECLNWAGGSVGRYCAAQGNILASDSVVSNMILAFESTTGELAEKLMAALLAGDSAGGDSRGRQSAALYVVKDIQGLKYDREIDIRVDDDPRPIAELYRLFGMARALSRLDDASHYYQSGELQMAVKAARKAVELGPSIPETYYDLACYLSLAGQFDEALAGIETAIKMNPRLKEMAANDQDLEPLKALPEFREIIK